MTSPSSSAQAARKRLADQLREIREDAGLTARELSRRAGWTTGTSKAAGVSKVSRIEHAHRAISAADLRTWCRVCDVPAEREERLLAELRAAETMWTTYKAMNRAGLLRAQKTVRDVFERLRLLRAYQSRTIPGLLQTPDWTRAALSLVRDEEQLGTSDEDLEAAVAERMDRQRVLRRAGKRFTYVVEETVLWYRPYARQIHEDQLRHLLAVTRMPSVSFGVIPHSVDRHGIRPREAFDIFDDQEVSTEMVSGYLRITTPDEIALYVRAWNGLRSLAVVGQAATDLINGALDDLRRGE